MKKGINTTPVRTRVDAANWCVLLEGYESSDLSIKDYCLSRGISATSFYQWRKRLDENKETAKTLFSPIELSSKLTRGVIELSTHKARLPIPADLPRVEEVIEPQEDVSDMKCIGEDVTEVLEYEAGRVWVRRIVRPKYARREENEEAAGGQIVQAPAKEMPPGAFKIRG